MKRAGAMGLTLLCAACVYFNAMYDARREYGRGVKAQRAGDQVGARVAFDSVIAITGRVVEDHPGSKYADDAAILKARSEIHNRRWEAAEASALRAAQLARDSASHSVAIGLRGVALSQLGRLEESDALLTLALAGPIGSDDRAAFMFNRGRTRLGLGRPGPAAEDLQTASRGMDLSSETRLDLAGALIEIGRYGEALELDGAVLEESRFGTLEPGLRAHLDTLSAYVPAAMDSMLAGMLATPNTQPTKQSTLHFLRGRARAHGGDPSGALASLDSAVSVAPNAVYASEAAYEASIQRLSTATRPEQITQALGSLERASRSSQASVAVDATRLRDRTQLFTQLMAAYDSRGAAAAEAVLRAAEIAGTELGSAAVARGLYLEYLDLVPRSPWTAKAIYGALRYSGSQPGGWVEDRGLATDAELRRRLSELPDDDPYRLAIEGRSAEGPLGDSLYVRAELSLRERIAAVQALFEPEGAPEAQVQDSSAARPDSAGRAAPQGEEF